MSSSAVSAAPDATTVRSAWSAVFCLTLMCFVLVAAEFMPVSLLTPISRDLAITPGQVGQAIAVSGIFAVITSLFGNTLLAWLDRRVVVMLYTAVAMLSAMVVTWAPDGLLFMLGRALIGVAIGGFWSLSTAIIARLVTPMDLPRAIAMLQGGTASATVFAAPLGTWLGEIIGWRGAFALLIPFCVVSLAWQLAVLPRLPAERPVSLQAMGGLMRNRVFALGQLATLLAFMGYVALATYLRPYLEMVVGFDGTAIALVLFGIGLAGIVGTAGITLLVRNWLGAVLIGLPLVMAAVAVLLSGAGSLTIAVVGLLLIWGFCFGAIPVSWNTWMVRIIPDQLEAGGSLQVALTQLAIATGSAAGGVLFDGLGWWGPLWLAVLIFSVCSLLASIVVRRRH